MLSSHSRVREAISKLPEPYYVSDLQYVDMLRPPEGCISISLIQQQDSFEHYYNKEKSLFEHF
jgi:hypothetical protein